MQARRSDAHHASLRPAADQLAYPPSEPGGRAARRLRIHPM